MRSSHDTKVLQHPIVGELTLHTEALTFPGDRDQTLFTFLADPGSASDEALTVLSAWAVDHGRPGQRGSGAEGGGRPLPYASGREELP
ncbi:MmyB family transcriptional regulator [Streptomyces sp. NBC_01497]|uniref:MmyB family transcriptional regulator n=1 Tax=Streptomyces sp. NBC_01497 TaxID=2903885 RepID=UPI002E32DCD8|nr:hypothetical protein [Streptomyces sp. NBC_01497]